MLNSERTIPYAFRVFESDGIVWLFDDSARDFPCTATPHVYAEPLYALDDDLLDYDGAYFLARDVERMETFPVPLDADDTAPDVAEKEAWDAAREEAQANIII